MALHLAISACTGFLFVALRPAAEALRAFLNIQN